DGNAGQRFDQRGLQMRRISRLGAVRSRQHGGARAQHQYVEFLVADGTCGVRQRKDVLNLMLSDQALLRRLSQRRTGEDRQRQHECQPSRHASPPTYPGVAAGGRGPDPRSTRLYHESSAAAATIMPIPARLTNTWVNRRFDTSVKTKCPANDRNTPRQNVSS